MKNDIATAVIATIVGVTAAYFVTNLFFGEIKDFSISVVDENLTVDLAEPDESIFNYLAINPTVEVIVGDCDDYDETTGECRSTENEPTDDTDTPTPDDEETEENNRIIWNANSSNSGNSNTRDNKSDEVEEDF